MSDYMFKVGGKPFRCSCGANVFRNGEEPGLWICKGCETVYADETYKPKEKKPFMLKDNPELKQAYLDTIKDLYKFDSYTSDCKDMKCPKLCDNGKDCIIYRAAGAIKELIGIIEEKEKGK